ncbi:metallophosphoesterase [Companilactobacillus muriivasis]|uniref:metallophosphoesterase n=1 Tax=Companilactobacillus muriivasis TaxID=3081444 RepID=UPI0030C70AC6
MTPNNFLFRLNLPFESIPFNNQITPSELLIIGDVHGDYDDLVEMLDAHSGADITLLGDYIDRGPQSGKVLNLLLEQNERLHLLSGNHEVNLRKRYIEKRTTVGRLQQDTVNQLAAEDIDENDIRDFLSNLDTYRAIHYADRDFILSHAGMEPSLTLKLEIKGGIDLVPSEVFIYGIKKEGESVYNRDVDFEWVNHPIKKSVMIHGHRNRFGRVAMTDKDNKATAINLTDADTSTFRYVIIHPDKTGEIHIRQRFSNDEEIVSVDL